MKQIIVWFTILVIILTTVLVLFVPARIVNESTTDSRLLTFESDQGILTVEYNEAANSAVFNNNGVTYKLEQTPSTSGKKYISTDGSIVFFEYEDDLTLEVDGVVVFPQETTKRTTNPTHVANELAGSMWKWEETEYSDGTIVRPVTSTFEISFSEDGFTGTTDCNSLMGTYKIDSGAGQLQFGPIAGTKMACPDSKNQELEFTNMLSVSTSYSLSDEGTLILSLRNDSGRMLFAMADKIVSVSEEVNDASETATEAVTFNGTVDSVSTACFADGICSATIDGKELILLEGWSVATVGEVRFSDGIGGLEAHIGKSVTVQAAQTPNGYTLYGSTDYYIEPAL